MLVRFHSEVGSVTLFGDSAKTLLRLMGMSGDVPGAVLAKDVPEALRRLREGVAARQAAEGAPAREEESKEGGTVKLSTRAFPLTQLLESAAKRGCDVIWEESGKSSG